MIHHIWSILCSSSSVDSATNNLSIFNTLEQINLQEPEDPSGRGVIGMTMEIVSLWHKDYEDTEIHGSARVILETPDGPVDGPPFELDFTSPTIRRLRTRQQMSALPMKGYGTYWFVVKMTDESDGTETEVARLPLDITKESPGIDA